MNGSIEKIVYEAAIKEAALQGIAVVAVSMDETGEILYFSHQAEVIFGYDFQEVYGCCVDILLPKDLRTAHAEHRKRFIEAPRTRPMGNGMILRGAKKDGTEFPIQVALYKTEVINKEVVIATIMDLTEPVKTALLIQQAITEDRKDSPV